MLHILQNQIVLNQQLDCRKLSQMVDVSKILKNVSENGDQAIINYMKEFDGVSVSSIPFPIGDFTPKEKSNNTELLQATAENIRKFHQRQFPASFTFVQKDGTCAEWKWRPIERVGIYVPGGRFSLVSSLLMNVIPAQVAGVKEIAVCTPPNKNGLPNASILNACKILSINEIYSVGGAQAIAALAYGTESISSVNKIVGPGNAYVAAAKQAVSSFVGVDMNAGPTEIVIIADENANPAYVAADLISQAEHDSEAIAILLTDSNKLAESVNKQIKIQIENLSTKEIVKKSFEKHGIIFLGKTISDCVKISNKIAPEHLSIQVKNTDIYLDQLIAGAIFLGDKSPIVWGDYWAGPNHTLPTGGHAKFRGPLNTMDFMVPYSIIDASSALDTSAEKVSNLAKLEGLNGHANSVDIRRKQ